MLQFEHVDKVYKVGTFGTEDLHAVRDVTFDVQRGEVVALIGESGSGKSTIGKMLLGLISITNGAIRFRGDDISGLKRKSLKEFYRHTQGVFQDPFSCYNPIFKVDRTFETLRTSFFPEISDEQWHDRLDEAIKAVSLEPDTVLGKFPHQLSGGQLQRLLIARALLLDIDMLVADEIISMLDASTRIDVLNLLGELKARGLGILFITHDLSLGNYVSDRVVILYKGRIVESGRTQVVFDNALHPYTRNLLASVPQLDKRWDDVEAEEATRAASLSGRCLYHEKEIGDDVSPTGVTEIEPEHQVGCFAMGADDPCPLTGAVVA